MGAGIVDVKTDEGRAAVKLLMAEITEEGTTPVVVGAGPVVRLGITVALPVA